MKEESASAYSAEPVINSAEELWRYAVHVSLQLVKALKFDGRDEVNRYFMALYASILEQNCSAIALRRAGLYAGIEQILRSNLEAYVDLVNLLSDKAYISNLKFEYHRQWINLAKAGVEGDNQFLAAFRDNNAAKEMMERHSAALTELKAAGIKKKHIEEKFKAIGMEDVYRSVYNSLCAEGHNDLRALISRHFFETDGGDAEIRFFAAPSQEAVDSTVDQFLGILLDSGIRVHRELDSHIGADALIALHDKRIEAARVDAEAFS